MRPTFTLLALAVFIANTMSCTQTEPPTTNEVTLHSILIDKWDEHCAPHPTTCADTFLVDPVNDTVYILTFPDGRAMNRPYAKPLRFIESRRKISGVLRYQFVLREDSEYDTIAGQYFRQQYE